MKLAAEVGFCIITPMMGARLAWYWLVLWAVIRARYCHRHRCCTAIGSCHFPLRYLAHLHFTFCHTPNVTCPAKLHPYLPTVTVYPWELVSVATVTFSEWPGGQGLQRATWDRQPLTEEAPSIQGDHRYCLQPLEHTNEDGLKVAAHHCLPCEISIFILIMGLECNGCGTWLPAQAPITCNNGQGVHQEKMKDWNLEAQESPVTLGHLSIH